MKLLSIFFDERSFYIMKKEEKIQILESLLCLADDIELEATHAFLTVLLKDKMNRGVQ